MKKTIEELQSEATAKGIKFDRRWGAKKLQRKIDSVVVSNDGYTIIVPAVVVAEVKKEVKDETTRESKPYRIKNVSPNRYEIGRFAINSMEILALSEDQLSDGYLMKRVFHHVEIGKFKVID